MAMRQKNSGTVLSYEPASICIRRITQVPPKRRSVYAWKIRSLRCAMLPVPQGNCLIVEIPRANRVPVDQVPTRFWLEPGVASRKPMLAKELLTSTENAWLPQFSFIAGKRKAFCALRFDNTSTWRNIDNALSTAETAFSGQVMSPEFVLRRACVWAVRQIAVRQDCVYATLGPLKSGVA